MASERPATRFGVGGAWALRSGRASALHVLAALAVLGPSAGCGHEPTPRPRGKGVLVIAVDALRADHLSCFGYDRDTTPTLDALAAEGAVFEHAFAAAPWLLPSHVSLLTGCDPNLARWRQDVVEASVEHRWHLTDPMPRLASQFLLAGYRTAGFVDHEWLGPVYGFHRGFQRYSEHDPFSLELRDGLVRKGRELVQWLRTLDAEEPWFAYLHVHDLERAWGFADPEADNYFDERAGLDWVPPVSNEDHAFFAVPRPRWQGGSVTLGRYEARYDGALRRLDGELRTLFEELRVSGRWDGTTVCVIGTHGVQFAEAGMILDHGLFSLADVHVPWIVRAPAGAGIQPGTRVAALASGMDLAPTLLDLADLPVPPAMQGVSQVGPLWGAREPARTMAFVSCGLQQGGAAFGERLAWEYTTPGNTAGDALRTSWYGDDLEHTGEAREIVYDWRETPYPFARPETWLERELAEDLRVGFRDHWLESRSLDLRFRPEVLERGEPTWLERLRSLVERR